MESSTEKEKPKLMSPQTWARIREVFGEAIDRSGEQRDFFVRDICGEDSQLRDAVFKLLARHDASNAFVDRPAVGAGAIHHLLVGAHDLARAFQDGEILSGRFRILKSLGEGGMGQVYEAEDLELKTQVAIKTLHPVLAANEKLADRFRREVQLARLVTHPNVCRVFDVGRHANTVYFSMELLRGETLAQRIETKGKMEVNAAVRLIEQICDGLAEAHSSRIVHRDLKCSNIFLVDAPGEAERTVITDFGLARDTSHFGSPLATNDTNTSGTPAYMSPEQIEGKVADVRSDIFSLGLMIYEMLSGRRAFAGTNAIATMAAIVHQDYAPLQSTPQLDFIVSRCLQKNPDSRFQSVAELKALLRGEASAGLARIPHPAAPSIAVLPFANMTGDQSNDFFGDGLAEETIGALSRITGLKVIARTSAFAFKGTSESITSIAKALQVTHILEGSIRRAGNRVRIVVQLVSAADSARIWSERYDRELTDIFAVQEEIATTILQELEAKFSTARLSRVVLRKTANAAAYEAYLEGRYWTLKFTSEGISKSMECFDRAIRLDPNYDSPHGAIGERATILALYLGARSRDVVPLGLASAERALQLNPDSAEALYARAVMRALSRFEWEAAGKDLDRAIEINPMYSGPNAFKAVWLLVHKRKAEALAQMEHALSLDPLNIYTRASELWLLNAASAHEKAVERAHALLTAFPSNWVAYFQAGVGFIGGQRLSEAEEAFRKGLELNPRNPNLMATLALVEGLRGDIAAAARVRAELEQSGGFVPLYLQAVACLGAGDLAGYYGFTAKSLDENEITTPLQLVSIRGILGSDPRFQALLKRVNLA